MGKNVQVLCGAPNRFYISRQSTIYNIETPTKVCYQIYIEAVLQDLVFIKSNDKGISWSNPSLILAGTVNSFSLYYDRWSNISAGLIHIGIIDGNNVKYVNIDTENNDTISAVATLLSGTSSTTGGTLSIVRTIGLNLICGGCIDSGVESFFKKSTDVGLNWSDITNAYEAAEDQIILMPGFAADNQDCICIYWDSSSNELSRKLYDDSANSWAETLISAGMVDPGGVIPIYPNFSAVVDLTNSQIILTAWTASDIANADLKCWTVTEGAITAKTDVITNSVDDQGMCLIALNTNNNYWYCFYCGKSDGSETYYTNINLYYKCSIDNGVSWGDETKVSNISNEIQTMYCCSRFTIPFNVSVINRYTLGAFTLNFLLNTYFENNTPRTTFQLGL